MTPDELGLLGAVAAAPEDDLPRLVYADWLEEHGRPQRAEFIRAGCRLAADPAGPDAPLLGERVGELGAWLGRHEPPAVPDPPLGVEQDYDDPADWHRGFPSRTAQGFLATS